MLLIVSFGSIIVTNENNENIKNMFVKYLYIHDFTNCTNILQRIIATYIFLKILEFHNVSYT